MTVRLPSPPPPQLCRARRLHRVVAMACALASAPFTGVGTAHADAPADPVAAIAPPAEASTPALDKARAHFLQGVQFYNNGDYKLSLVEFRRSYELSKNYRILFNIGQVNQQLNNYANALDALERYLREGGADVSDERRLEVAAYVDQLKKRVAHVRLELSESSAEVLIDEFPVDARIRNGVITLDPGDHRIEARKIGFHSATSVITVTAGEVSEVRLTLTKIAAPVFAVPVGGATVAPKRDHTWLWVGWGTTAAAALGAGVTGVLASGQASELANLRNSASSTQDERDRVGNRAKSFAVASDVLTGTAVVLGATSLYFTLSSGAKKTEQSPAPTTRVRVGTKTVSLVRTF